MRRIYARARDLVCTKCGGVMGNHRPGCSARKCDSGRCRHFCCCA